MKNKSESLRQDEANPQGRVPKLRFPEFRDAPEWEERFLSNIAELIEKRAGSNKYTLMSVTAGIGLVTQIEKFGREIAGNAYKNYYVIKKGDFAYNKSATKQYTEGFISMLADQNEAALPNSIFTCFRIVDKDTYPQFLNHIFHANFHGIWLRKFIAVGARAHGSLNVDSDDLFKMPIKLPSFPEQQKIADCLSSLNELIATHTQKLNALNAHKKGLMQQLFPAEGETVPKLRFPEFRDAPEWEEKALGDISYSVSSGKDKNEPDGSYDLYGSTGVIGKTLNVTFDGQFILIARVGANAGLLTKTNGKFGVTDNTLVVCLHKTVNIDFIFAALERFGLNKLIFGSGQPLITGSQVKSISVYLPKGAEQQKIADCLSSLDELISVEAQKLDTLKAHKKGMMQQLFPFADEVNE